jgi:ankyrin repeat protein
LKWIVKTWNATPSKDLKKELQKIDAEGMTPLIAICHHGSAVPQNEVQQKSFAKQKEIKEKRKMCAQLLLDEGADISAVTPHMNMSALHWASFIGDRQLCKFLLMRGALITVS